MNKKSSVTCTDQQLRVQLWGSDTPLKWVYNYVRLLPLMAYTKGLMQDGKYYYMKDLLDLDSHRPQKEVSQLFMSPEVCLPLVNTFSLGRSAISPSRQIIGGVYTQYSAGSSQYQWCKSIRVFQHNILNLRSKQQVNTKVK